MEHQALIQTRHWVEKVVVGFNFCPFAYRELERGSIRFVLSEALSIEDALQDLLQEIEYLDDNPDTETTLLVFALNFSDFEDYLDLADLADALVFEQGYEGTYQVATFHPQYRFADTTEDDAANYTNRSPFPMLHLLREETVERAIAQLADPEAIPRRNVEFAREKGLAYMQVIWEEISGKNL